jgi:hypothetical protein
MSHGLLQHFSNIWWYLINIIPQIPQSSNGSSPESRLQRSSGFVGTGRKVFIRRAPIDCVQRVFTGRSQIAEEKWKDRGGNWRNAHIYHWTFTFLGSSRLAFRSLVVDGSWPFVLIKCVSVNPDFYIPHTQLKRHSHFFSRQFLDMSWSAKRNAGCHGGGRISHTSDIWYPLVI